MLALDHRGLHAELRRADRRDVAARPAADKNGIETAFSQSDYSLRSTGEGRFQAFAVVRS